MTMSVHDALEAWSEGHLDLERAFELTGAVDVEEMLLMCDSCDVPRPTNREYDADALRILEGMEPPPRRLAGHVHEPAHVVATVILTGDGRLFVEAPGSPPTRIVAIPAKRAAAVGQRVAELVEEALAAQARVGEGEA